MLHHAKGRPQVNPVQKLSGFFEPLLICNGLKETFCDQISLYLDSWYIDSYYSLHWYWYEDACSGSGYTVYVKALKVAEF